MDTPDELTPAEALVDRGNRHLAAGEDALAKACFREAIRLAPELAQAHTNLGLVLDKEGGQDEAEYHLRYALALNPRSGNTLVNLGVLLSGRKRFEEAEDAFGKAQELIPDSPALWLNLGVLQTCRGEDSEAERCFRRALELSADYRSAQFNLSYLLLRQGRMEEGWPLFEARDWYAHLERNIPCPRWRGESLEGRSLIIGFEAGHGDMIQFCRYAALLKGRGAKRIALVCHPPLKGLFVTLKGVDDVFDFYETLPPHDWDYWVPPLSMPFYCGNGGNSIFADLPYLRAEGRLVDRWERRLSGRSLPSQMRVGLVWKGNPHFENDADRSLPGLETLESLGTVAGVRFFSLQKGAGENEAAAPPAGLPVVDLGSDIADFTDTAAIVEGLDLVICVDTAVAHLAGALAKRCWVLLPFHKTDWRWQTGRNDSPWYPGVMRLFRQPRLGDWDAVVAELRQALTEAAASRNRQAPSPDDPALHLA